MAKNLNAYNIVLLHDFFTSFIWITLILNLKFLAYAYHELWTVGKILN